MAVSVAWERYHVPETISYVTDCFSDAVALSVKQYVEKDYPYCMKTCLIKQSGTLLAVSVVR